MRSSCLNRFATKLAFALLALVISCPAFAQILSPEQEVEVHNLPAVTAKSQDPSDVLLASLETILNDEDVCCGKDSALVDALASVDSKSWKDIDAKLEGRHLLSDGRPTHVKTICLTPEMLNGASLLHLVLDQHASLIQ